MNKYTWAEFNRFRINEDNDNFYGCVDKDGEWFDSSMAFDVAVHWCCYANGEFELTPEQELAWFEVKGRELGLSIIHGTMIHKMYDAGLIK